MYDICDFTLLITLIMVHYKCAYRVDYHESRGDGRFWFTGQSWNDRGIVWYVDIVSGGNDWLFRTGMNMIHTILHTRLIENLSRVSMFQSFIRSFTEERKEVT